MTNYSTNLKIGIISSYLNHENSLRGLAKEYCLDFVMKKWADLAEAQDLIAFKVKHNKHTFSSHFKLNVVRYYLTNEISASKTAVKFDLSTSQVHVWTKLFEEQASSVYLPKERHRKPAIKSSA